MEAQPRGDIEFQIRMMHAVQPPKPRHGMKGHMLAVDDEIEQEPATGIATQPGR
jgi:hypothetical protein